MILRVDLTSGMSTVSDGQPGVRLLLDETAPGLSAYHPDQPIVFGVGHRALAMTRFTLTAKSPQSGGIAESRVEGPFGPALGDTGFDGVVLTGRADHPCYVILENGQARVIDAVDLWGMDTAQATDELVSRHGPSAHVAVIGPVGENLVRFASLVTDRGYPAARMGAVFGAKRCKAVVVVNDHPRPVIELDLMQLWSGYDALGVCLFAAPPTRNLTEESAAELVSAVTGRKVTPTGVRAAGRERLMLMRQYNRREGLTSADDTLPDRFFTLPVGSGRLKGAVLDRQVFHTAVGRLRDLLGRPPG